MGRSAKEAGLLQDKVELLQTKAKVSAPELGQAVLATALLANEQVGNVRLEIRSKKALFGLRSVKTLYAEAGETVTDWPECSLEAQILPLVQGGSVEVSDLLYALLKRTPATPGNGYWRSSKAGWWLATCWKWKIPRF